MNRFFSRNLTLWLTIFTLLWGSQGYGYVWCVATDGATHLKSALENHCEGECHPELTPASEFELSEIDLHTCSPCVDLAANHETLHSRPFSAPPLLFPLSNLDFPSVPCDFPPLLSQLETTLHYEAPFRIDRSILTLRTIVLLI